MVKVDPDLQRIAGKPAYLAFLSDTRGWGTFICVWTQSVPIWVTISSAGTSQKNLRGNHMAVGLSNVDVSVKQNYEFWKQILRDE